MIMPALRTLVSSASRAVPWIVAWSACAALAGAYPAHAVTNPNDGRWSIEVITDSGDCDKAYRYSVLVENGEARYGGREPITVSGKVASNGSVKGAIAYGDNRANVAGRLSSGFGNGTWTFNGSRICSGHWNAERRG